MTWSEAGFRLPRTRPGRGAKASLTQKTLFEWDQIEALGDLRRLRLVLENLYDEALMKKLEQERYRGRDDYPIRPMWNALISGVVFQHPTVEALLRS